MEAVHRSTSAASQVTRRSAQGTAELRQALSELVQEQARHNVAILTALSEAVDWERVIRTQSEFLLASLERMAGLAQRYLEAGQAVLTVATTVGGAGGRNRGGSEAT